MERAVASMCFGAASPDQAERRIVVGFVITIALANMKDNITCVASVGDCIGVSSC